MQDQFPFPLKKTCGVAFLITCIFLTIFYYDKAILDYNLGIEASDVLFAVNATNETKTQEIDAVSLKANNSNTVKKTTQIPEGRITSNTPITPVKVSESPRVTRRTLQSEDFRFLVSSPKCKIVDLDPFNKDAAKYYRHERYKPCRKLPLLTYVNKTDNTAFLHIDNEVLPSYDKEGVSCCHSTVKRQSENTIKISKCQYFQKNISIQADPVMVKCTNSRHKKVYENVHAPVIITEKIREKLNSAQSAKKPLSVLFIGIDSISRLNLIRALPNTFQYVESNDWIPLKGYNKIDDNTFPNLMAILTGFNQTRAMKICNPKEVGKLDKCPILWYDYRNFGYVTGYAEDEGPINTFNYLKEGFQTPPTDYYFRPYILATEQLKKVTKDSMFYCTGPETAGERIMNIAKDFANTFKKNPSFGFFWMNSFSHNSINAPSGMDLKIRNSLKTLAEEAGENTIIIFLSDHGMRFGDFRYTDAGWQEERLPFIYVFFPKRFKRNYAKEYYNFKSNSDKLVCPYDVHMTLKHILVLSGHNYTITNSDACPKCKSLFERIETERSCEDAGIAQHWCTCTGYTTTHLQKNLQNNFTDYIIDQINRRRQGDNYCAKFSLDEVIAVGKSQKLAYKNETSLLIKLKTHPKAVFETTLKFDSDISSKFSLSGDISRLDSYNDHSKCVSDGYVKKFCYCQK